MTKISISADFLESYAKIPKAQQKRVREFTEKFCADPTSSSINYEPIHDMRDDKVRTVRISLDYRAIVIHPPLGDVYMLVWVDHHDEAMRWARHKIFSVHPTTGTIQIVDVEHIVHQTPLVDPPILGLFHMYQDEQLEQIGVPSLLLPTVRSISSEDELDVLKNYVSIDIYERLFYLASGFSLEEVIQQISIPRAPVNVLDFSSAVRQEESRRSFVVISTTKELQDLLDKPLEKWRLFLHPSQEQLVHGNFQGPTKVLGGAGTGKTVVLLHRAKYVAQNASPGSRYLVLTYTSNLAKVLQNQLRTIIPEEHFDRIEVTTIHSWALRYIRSRGITSDPISKENDSFIFDSWQQAIRIHNEQTWDINFFQEEWEEVIQFYGIDQEEKYLHIPRIGRGTRLTRDERRRVWRVLAQYRATIQQAGLLDWVDIVRKARQLLEKYGGPPKFDGIFVDEGQDLHQEDYKLIRRLVQEGPNDIFIVGDTHQRIYKNKVVLSHCGIQIKGRSKKLRINYRTTEQIRRWAFGLLEGLTLDDLDGGVDTHQGYISLLQGEAPEIRHFDSQEEEVHFVRDVVNSAILEGVDLSNLCIIARSTSILEHLYVPMLEKDRIPYVFLNPSVAEQGEGVRLSTMHRVKGLEFSYVIIVAVNEYVIPPHSAWLQTGDYISKQELTKRETSLLYVATTRARNHLIVTSSGTPSILLPRGKEDKDEFTTV